MYQKCRLILLIPLIAILLCPSESWGQNDEKEETVDFAGEARYNASSFYATLGAGMSAFLATYVNSSGVVREFLSFGTKDSQFSPLLSTVGSALVLGAFVMSLEQPTSLEKNSGEQKIDLEEVKDEFLEFQVDGAPLISIDEMRHRYPSLHKYLKWLRQERSDNESLNRYDLFRLARKNLFE